MATSMGSSGPMAQSRTTLIWIIGAVVFLALIVFAMRNSGTDAVGTGPSRDATMGTTQDTNRSTDSSGMSGTSGGGSNSGPTETTNNSGSTDNRKSTDK